MLLWAHTHGWHVSSKCVEDKAPGQKPPYRKVHDIVMTRVRWDKTEYAYGRDPDLRTAMMDAFAQCKTAEG